MAIEVVNFMLCVANGGAEDLEVRKLYEILPDDEAAKESYVRVVDESGEDYLYPSEYFHPIEISADLRDSLLHAA